MAIKLTPKQENFCLAYLETGNASEAYRVSSYSKKMSEKSVNEVASKLLNNIKIVSRLEELRKPIMKRHNITIDSLIDELEEARQAALTAESVQSSAAVSATMSKAKLLGMDKQIIEHTSPDGSMTPKSAITLNQTDIKNILTKINEGI